MNDYSNSPKLVFEEKKAIKFFMFLFYVIFIFFDIISYFVIPHFLPTYPVGKINEGLGYWFYILNLAIIPVGIFFIKRDNPYIVKYIILVGYIFLDVTDSLIRYMGTKNEYAAGNIAELLFVIFSPIFLNKKYYWSVTLGLTGKYFVLAAILLTTKAILPAFSIAIFSGITYILLNRFESYLKSLTAINNELYKKEKLAIIGQMATAIGHEIRNPIASLRGFIQLQKERYPDTNDHYRIMIQEVDRINSIVNDLMFIGKPKVPQFEKADVQEIIDYTLNVMHQQAEWNNVDIELKVEEQLPEIECDKNQLKQVFINLIKNAIEAMPDGGNIHISVIQLNDSQISIKIEDEGCGISQEAISSLGTPFYSTKRDGTGLGLMVSNQIIEDHSGEMKIDSQQGKGTNLIIKLPINKNK
ncbi:ATP-binding protein [Neobacillus sp. LXY-1]|uniref:ATP-binding protein n=1 Tax=Neobacillus sp. LXY-1 TaxID=3379133 RepID=UPI003EE2D33D